MNNSRETATAKQRVVLRLATVALLALNAYGAGVLTVQIGPPPTPPIPLVNHGDTWHFHKGTNAPQTNWQTIPDAVLDGTWATAPGGFGYGDAGIVGEATTLSDMRNSYTTFFIRRTFEITSQIDTNRHLLLTVDYDDGFVAYLDGQEIARANTTNGVGSVITYNQTTGTRSHEASCCNPPVNPATTYDLGPVGQRLGMGSHILAVVGLNQAPDSSDFHLIVDLAVGSSANQGIVSGNLLSVVSSNAVVLSGSNTVAGSTRLIINGDDAAYNVNNGTWSSVQSLAQGVNWFFIAAADSAGTILAGTNLLIVSKQAETYAGGLLGSNTLWTEEMGIIYVTNKIIVPAGGTLTVSNGVVVLFAAGAGMVATNATIEVYGQSDSPVYFLPSNGTSNWGGLISSGTNGLLIIRHAEIAAASVQVVSGATGLLENCTLRDYMVSVPPLVYVDNANSITVRRCHLTRYYETHFLTTPTIIEDSLFEYLNSANNDGIDFDTVPAGSAIRRCTFRHALQSNSDAIDLGTGCEATVVENCIMYDLSDKGVSVGENSQGILVRNCLMFNVDAGVAVKDSCTAQLESLTVVDSNYGIHIYQKNAGAGGGHVTNAHNLILWGNLTNIGMDSLSTIELNYSNVGDTNWPGTGNISSDPLFVNAASRDYRLASNSPCRGAGLNGADMGFKPPIGGLPGAPLWLAAFTNGINPLTISWIDDSINETAFLVERSVDKLNWQQIAVLDKDVTTYTDTNGIAGQSYYYRVRATNAAGASPYSNLAKGQQLASVTPPEFLAITRQAEDVILTFNAQSGLAYSILYRDALDATHPWQKLMDVPAHSSNSTVTITNTQFLIPRRFFTITTPTWP